MEKGQPDTTLCKTFCDCSFNSVQMKGRRQGEESSDWNIAAASSLCLLVLLADALLPGVLPLVLPVAVRGVEDPAGQRDGLRRQLLLGDAALSQVGFRRHGRRLRPAVGDVVRAVSGSVVVRRRAVGVAVQAGVGVSVGMRVGVRVRGGAAVVEGADLVYGVHLWSAVVDVEVGRGQVLVRGGPQVTGKRFQGVVPDGARFRILASEVTLTQRGHPAAGAAWQGGVAATQSWLRTGGRARDRVQRRLERENQRDSGCAVQHRVSSVVTTTWTSTPLTLPSHAVRNIGKTSYKWEQTTSQQLPHHSDIVLPTLRHLNMAS